MSITFILQMNILNIRLVRVMKKLVAVVLLAAMLVAVPMFISPTQAVSEQELFSVTQSGVTYVVAPIEGVMSAVDFYDYYSDSGHTPYMEDLVSKIYLYRDTTSGELSLIMHHSIDDSVSDCMRVDFYIEGIPEGAYTALSDDPYHPWNETRPEGREFDLTLEPEGNWEHSYNSDGGIIGGLSTDNTWCITICPYFIEGIEAWAYQTEDGQIELNMTQPIAICSNVRQISPVPDVGLTFEEVTSTGSVTVTKTTTGPSLPPGQTLVGPYYDIEVTVGFSGNVMLAIKYDDSGLSIPEKCLRLAQYDLISGDVNLDGIVNCKDLLAIIKALGSYSGHPRWNPNCDINGDGKVNVIDFCIALRNFGKTSWNDITSFVDVENNIIYGETNRFSIFGVHR
jgi:hypothetical protein